MRRTFLPVALVAALFACAHQREFLFVAEIEVLHDHGGPEADLIPGQAVAKAAGKRADHDPAPPGKIDPIYSAIGVAVVLAGVVLLASPHWMLARS